MTIEQMVKTYHSVLSKLVIHPVLLSSPWNFTLPCFPEFLILTITWHSSTNDQFHPPSGYEVHTMACCHLINDHLHYSLCTGQSKTGAGKHKTNRLKNPVADSPSLICSVLFSYLATEVGIRVVILPECGPVTVNWMYIVHFPSWSWKPFERIAGPGCASSCSSMPHPLY